MLKQSFYESSIQGYRKYAIAYKSKKGLLEIVSAYLFKGKNKRMKKFTG